MIEEQAIVVALRGDQALVQTERRSTCSGCAARGGCGAGLLSRLVGRRFAELSVPNEIGLEIGDRVVLGLSEAGLVRGALAMYALPLLGMLAGGLLGQLALGGTEMMAIIGAAVGLGAGFALARAYLLSSASAAKLKLRVLRRLPAVSQVGVGMLAP
jgi:sigma-E factor negative regulatory protein RseC